MTTQKKLDLIQMFIDSLNYCEQNGLDPIGIIITDAHISTNEKMNVGGICLPIGKGIHLGQLSQIIFHASVLEFSKLLTNGGDFIETSHSSEGFKPSEN